MLIKQTKEELEIFKQQYLNLGYEVIRADEPNELKFGYLAFQKGSNVACYLPKFPDAKVNPCVRMESADGFVRLFESYKGLKHFYKADAPKQLMRGFAVFNPDTNEISSYQIRFSAFNPHHKQAGDEMFSLPELTLE